MSKADNKYLGNPLVRGADVPHEWVKEELLEYQKCLTDPVYFAETYCKVINLDEGLVPFVLYPCPFLSPFDAIYILTPSVEFGYDVPIL